MKAAAASAVFCRHLIGEEGMMTNGQRSFISCRGFLQDRHNHRIQLKDKKAKRVRIRFLRKWIRCIIQPFCHFKQQSWGCTYFVLLCRALWKCSSRSAFIMYYRILDMISATRRNEWAKWACLWSAYFVHISAVVIVQLCYLSGLAA